MTALNRNPRVSTRRGQSPRAMPLLRRSPGPDPRTVFGGLGGKKPGGFFDNQPTGCQFGRKAGILFTQC